MVKMPPVNEYWRMQASRGLLDFWVASLASTMGDDCGQEHIPTAFAIWGEDRSSAPESETLRTWAMGPISPESPPAQDMPRAPHTVKHCVLELGDQLPLYIALIAVFIVLALQCSWAAFVSPFNQEHQLESISICSPQSAEAVYLTLCCST